MAQDNRTLESYCFKFKIYCAVKSYKLARRCLTTRGPKVLVLDGAFPGYSVGIGSHLPSKSPNINHCESYLWRFTYEIGVKQRIFQVW